MVLPWLADDSPIVDKLGLLEVEWRPLPKASSCGDWMVVAEEARDAILEKRKVNFDFGGSRIEENRKRMKSALLSVKGKK